MFAGGVVFWVGIVVFLVGVLALAANFVFENQTPGGNQESWSTRYGDPTEISAKAGVWESADPGTLR